jgi:solute carrier family 25 thiamine pyrophosphate transporter 19
LFREYLHVGDDRWYSLQTSLNGSLSGVTAKTIVYPFDVTKKRLQIQGFEEARQTFGKVVKFTGLFNCIYVTIKQEGIFGLYKGYLPSMLKAAFSSGLIFFTYESLSNLVRRAKIATDINE